MRSYPVYLVQYSGSKHTPEDPQRHMEIFAVTDKDSNKGVGVAFHITGDITSWKFTVSKTYKCVNNRYAGRIHLSNIPATQDELDRLEELLQTVPIVHNDRKYNCQRWAWLAGRLMHEKGYEIHNLAANFTTFLKDMQAVYDAWDTGADSD